MTAPHILVLNVYFAPYTYGGATVVAEEVARALVRDHGMRVTAISAMSRNDIAPYSIVKSEVGGIVNYLINLPGGRTYDDTYDNPAVTALVADLLPVIAPDVVHAHCVQDVGAGILGAVKKAGLPLVLSTHDFWWICERQFMVRPSGTYCGQDPVDIEACKGCVDDLERARLRHQRLRAAAAQADLITYPSDFARGLYERSGLSGDQSMVWTNGIHPPGPDFFEMQAKRRTARPQLSFGYLGGPSDIKGWPVIRGAFEQLETTTPLDVHVADGSLDNSWWAQVNFTKLAGNWQVHPRFSQSGMDAFYAQIDVLLFISQWRETFGLTIREALARGIRVIQTDSGGTTEHGHADPAHMLAIGDGPDRLIPELARVLATPNDHPAALPYHSFADQADDLVKRLPALMALKKDPDKAD